VDLSTEEFRKIVKAFSDSAQKIPRKVVETDEQAKQMTRADPCGHVWVKGEEYYEKLI
jgi:cell fate regulator YaaT (PSP1 superfamily)